MIFKTKQFATSPYKTQYLKLLEQNCTSNNLQSFEQQSPIIENDYLLQLVSANKVYN